MGERKKKSKKQFATRSWRPDPSLTYFLDENLGGSVIASALRAIGATVEVHKDHFVPGVPDVEWLSEVTRKGWVVITRDRRVRYRPNEIATIRAVGARIVVVVGGSLTGPDLAVLLTTRLGVIEAVMTGNPQSMMFTLSKSGRISRLDTRESSK